MTWEELERRFNELAPALQFTTVQGQWGAAGEHWHLGGGPITEAHRRFETLVSIAGSKLMGLLASQPGIPDELMSENDPGRFWYKAIWKLGGSFRNGVVGEMRDDQGNSRGYIFTGDIGRPAEASGSLCLKLMATYPDTPTAQPPESLLELKPGAWGVHIDLKVLWARLKHWRSSRRPRQGA